MSDNKFHPEPLDHWEALSRFVRKFGKVPVLGQAQKAADFEKMVRKSLETGITEPGLKLREPGAKAPAFR